jgi:IS5 family transposase
MTLATIFRKLDLSEIKQILYSRYKYKHGKPGRPPNSPVGMILSMVLMLVKDYSTRDIEAFLRRDKFWRRLLGFKKKEPDNTSFSDFLERIGIETFTEVFRILLQQLVDMGVMQSDMVAVDSTIILATRNDPDARWTKIRNKEYFGYKIHLIACVNSELPLALVVTPANEADCKQFNALYKSLPYIPRSVIGDSAYDTAEVRNTAVAEGYGRAYIKVNLRGNKRIKPYYSKEWREKYKKRTAIERLNSRLKNFLHLKKLRVRGIKAVTCYAYLGCIATLLFALIGKFLGKSIRGIKSLFR